MSLINCPECNKEISDQAESCPHCGHLVRSPETPEAASRNAPVFLVLSLIALVLMLGTPRLLLFFPLMGTLGFAAISLIRKEKGRAGAVLVLILGGGLWVLGDVSRSIPTGSDTGSSGSRSSRSSFNLDAADIVDFNWKKEVFSSGGRIVWNVKVRNKSSRNIKMARIQFETYDRGGNLISSHFTYVRAIPAGQTRSTNYYSDYYGTEERATADITRIRFAD